MNKLACFVHRILFLGAAMCIITSANLMLDYNWPAPDSNINRFPHESSCHYYYLMLSEEDISIEKCPDGQLFDYFKHSCISDKEHVHCWSRHFGKIKHDNMHIKHKKHFKCPYPWGKYPNLHDCTKYHLCLNGKSKIKKCAPFELFDKISRKCIASINAVCADKTDVVEHGYVCPKTWGSFTFMKDCSKYYECLQRKPSVRTCQKGYLFDDRLAQCAPEKHVYCGLRHNPYEKVTSDISETSSVTSAQKSTTLSLEVSTITTTEKIATVKPTSQETKSIPQEASSTLEVTSLPQKVTTLQKPASLPQEIFRISYEISSTQPPINKPTMGDILNPLLVQEINNNEIKQNSTIVTTIPNTMKLKKHLERKDVTESASEKKEFVEVSSTTEEKQDTSSSKISFNDEPKDFKKDVSTEENDTGDVTPTKVVTVETQGIERALESSTNSFSKPGCFPEDLMCTTEKDGTVVKCSSTKDLQPHPKDETRFLDCTGFKIQIYTCPPNLIFHPKDKKCRWQLIL